MSKETETLTEGLKSSPSLIAILAIVAAFIWYLVRHDQIGMHRQSAEDLVAKQRIEQCHKIQHESNVIMDKLNTSLNSQGLAFAELTIAIRDLRQVVEVHNTKMNDILNQLRSLEMLIQNKRNEEV
jgi:hypothetical protein